MNLDLVAEEVRTALAAISGLRRPPWGVEKITPPAVIVALPERIDYDQTYVRGSDRYSDMAVIVLVGKPEQRASRKAIAVYADGSGPRSVKAVLEAYTYTSCDGVAVPWCEFDTAKLGGTEYLVAIFHLDITGRGA